MKKEKSNLDNTTSKLDEMIKSMDIDSSNFERLGSTLISLGYSFFINATNVDRLEALNKNNTGITANDIIIFGQRFNVLGYFLLFISVSKRIQAKSSENLDGSKNNTLSIFQNIKSAYLGSFILNYLRLVDFIKLSKIE